MILVDTSIWIEFLRNHSPYFPVLKILMENQQVVSTEWIFAELLQGAKNETEVETILKFWENIPHINHPDIWLKAGRASQKHNWSSKGVGLFDAAIIVSAQQSKALIWTLDSKILKVLHRNEIYIPIIRK